MALWRWVNGPKKSHLIWEMLRRMSGSATLCLLCKSVKLYHYVCKEIVKTFPWMFDDTCRRADYKDIWVATSVHLKLTLTRV